LTDAKTHWDRVYSTRESADLSWFQLEPATSLRLLDRAGVTAST
jgi:hypothetical protein